MSRLLERTWMQSEHRYNPRDLGPHVVHLRETKPHALSHANTLSTAEQEDNARREREARAMFDALSELDREILRLSQTFDGRKEAQLQFPASKRDEQEVAGWLYVKTLKNGYVLMAKTFLTAPTHEDIGRRVKLTARQVRYRLSKMPADLVKFALLCGWT